MIKTKIGTRASIDNALAWATEVVVTGEAEAGAGTVVAGDGVEAGAGVGLGVEEALGVGTVEAGAGLGTVAVGAEGSVGLGTEMVVTQKTLKEETEEHHLGVEVTLKSLTERTDGLHLVVGLGAVEALETMTMKTAKGGTRTVIPHRAGVDSEGAEVGSEETEGAASGEAGVAAAGEDLGEVKGVDLVKAQALAWTREVDRIRRLLLMTKLQHI